VRLISAALALALTPAFVALPTVSFAASAKPRPVAPSVVSDHIGGIDATAAATAPMAPSTTRQSGATANPKMSVLTGQQAHKRFTVAGVSWARSADIKATDVTVHMRVKEDTGWTGWETLAIPDDGPDSSTGEASGARIGTTPLVTNGATSVQVRVDTPGGRALPDLKVTTIDPGSSPADGNLTPATPAGSASAAALQPTIITRTQWGADERLRGSMTLSSTVKSIVIHHTAGANDYTPATAAAQVRGIYAYDTLGLGWQDIAYNFLVDKWGRVYEGRAGSITLPVRGAHAMGFNTDTMGIAAMGNYETTAAPAAMVDSLAKVAGWKLSQYGVNPLGTARLTSQGGAGTKYAAGVSVTLPAINAHENTSYTLCPGKYLYPFMDTIRQKAALYASTSMTSTPPPVSTANLYAAYGSQTLAAGSTGWAVRDLQLELNRRGFPIGTADGDFGALTTTAVTSFQKAARLPQTGRVASEDWKALSNLPYTQVPSTPLPAMPGFNADGRGDVIGRTGTGDLYFYPSGVGTIGSPVRIGAGWGGFAQLVSPGDWNGDRWADVLALTTTGDLYLYKGNGKGGFLAAGTMVARGLSGYTDLVAPGDWNGDKKPDLLARKANGELWLLTGNGTGGFSSAPRKIATGWQMYTQLITPGDATGDGRPDLLGRTPAGSLYLYAGTGSTAGTATGYQPSKVVGRGWQVFNTVISTGDVTGDGRADLIARTPGNVNYVYPGTGVGTFLAGKRITVPWGATTRLFGVR
jgi:peptidoglycan hydrolase-like protein with peptidoglycan-binding domain